MILTMRSVRIVHIQQRFSKRRIDNINNFLAILYVF
jgi:hypothetical protein